MGLIRIKRLCDAARSVVIIVGIHNYSFYGRSVYTMFFRILFCDQHKGPIVSSSISSIVYCRLCGGEWLNMFHSTVCTIVHH